MLVQPEELFGVEDRRRFPDVIKGEIADELVHREYLLVAVRPAEPHQVVDEGLRQVAHLLVGQYGCGTVAFAKSCLVGPEDHRDMGKSRHRVPQRPVKEYLPRRVVQVVVAADDVRDSHLRVVDNDGEVVSRIAVGPLDDEVVEFFVVEMDGSFD